MGSCISNPFISIILSMLLFAVSFAQEDSAEKAKNLVVMIAADESIGAGVVVGVARNRVYIVTANHVVRPNNSDASTITIEFWQLPGEFFDVTLLTPLSSTYDLAVLSIPFDELGLTEADFPFELLRGGDVATSDVIHLIGHGAGRPWNKLDEQMNLMGNNEGIFEVQSASISLGDSGGAVFTKDGLFLGTIVSDSPPAVKVVKAEVLFEILEGNRYPIGSPQNDSNEATAVNADSGNSDQDVTNTTGQNSSEPPHAEEKINVIGVRDSFHSSARYDGRNVVDGETSTYWSSWSSKLGATLTLVFDQPRTITKLRTFFDDGHIAHYPTVIEISTPAGESQTIQIIGLYGWEDLTLNPIMTDTITLKIKEAEIGVGDFIHIYEVEFYGY